MFLILGFIVLLIIIWAGQKHLKYMKVRSGQIETLKKIIQTGDGDMSKLKSQLELGTAEQNKHKEMYAKCADDSEGLIAVWEEKLLGRTNQYSQEKKKYEACSSNSKTQNRLFSESKNKSRSLERKLMEATSKNNSLSAEEALLKDSLLQQSNDYNSVKSKYDKLAVVNANYQNSHKNNNQKYSDLENKLQECIVQTAAQKDLLAGVSTKLQDYQENPYVFMRFRGDAKTVSDAPYKTMIHKNMKESSKLCLRDKECRAITTFGGTTLVPNVTQFHSGVTIANSVGWKAFTKAIGYP
jgi:hypothetical protein